MFVLAPDNMLIDGFNGLEPYIMSIPPIYHQRM